MSGKLIVIDGIDGTGKTTAAKALASRLGGVYFPTPAAELKEARKYFANQNQTAKLLFYLGALINSAEAITRQLVDCDVVVDRYLASTICYHRIDGAVVDCIDWKSLPIRKPDIEFCLTVSDSIEWLRRISNRDGDTVMASIDSDRHRFLSIAEDISTFILSRGGVLIDTSCLAPDLVVERMLECLSTH